VGRADPNPSASPGRRSDDGVILRTASGGGVLLGGGLFEFASRFLVAFLLARLLGAEGYGLYNLGISAAALLTGVAALGLDDAMVRYVAIQSGRGDQLGLRGTVQLGLGTSLVTGVLGGLVLHAAADSIAIHLFNEAELAPLLRLLALVMPFLTLSNALLGCARGLSRMGYAAFAENVLQTVVRTGLLVAFALIELTPRLAIIAFGLADVVSSIAMVLLLNRDLNFRELMRRRGRRDVSEIVGFALPLWASGLLNSFRRNVETVFLGALSTTANVGVYTVVNRVNFIGHIGYRALIVSVKPVLAQLHAEGDRAALARVYRATTRWTLAANAPFFLVMVLYAKPLLSVFGDQFAAGSGALVVIAFGELVVAGTGICGSILDMTRHTRVKLLNSVLWLVAIVVSNGLLIPRWGVMGAAWASLIATTFINLLRLGEVWVLERVHPYGWTIWKPATATLSAAGVGLALRALLPDATPLTAAGQGLAVVGAYAAVTVGVGLTEEDHLVLDRLVRRVRRRRKARGR
jgi:O-antigen/teichoic acid export membrane protein